MGLSASDAARFQAYRTRARMGVQLWRQALTLTLLAWGALTIYVVWRQTGIFFPQLQHAYFWRWIICGILTRTPMLSAIALRCSVPFNGGWYPVGAFTDWLNSDQMYHLPSTYWLWHYGIRTALIPLGFGAGVIAWRSRHSLDSIHIRGLRLLTPREHNRQLNGRSVCQMLRRKRGIQVGNSTIPRDRECEHFLITGSPGAGKSTLIRQMLTRVRDRCQTAIVLDVDSEFIQEFYDEGRGDVVLNPLDCRCPFWSPWLEFRDESFTMDAEAMAASLVRGAPRTPTEEFFRDSARTLIEAIFEKVSDRRHSGGIADFLALPRPEIHDTTRRHAGLSAGRRARCGTGNRHHLGRRERNQGLLPPAAQRADPPHLERAPMGSPTARLDISAVNRRRPCGNPRHSRCLARRFDALADGRRHR